MQVKAPKRKKIKFPFTTYSFNKKYNFLFCPIPKVACSSFKRIIVLCSDNSRKEEIIRESKFHGQFNRNFTLSSLPYDEAVEILNNNSIFKFAFVRNPWERLLSAYLNKFVDKKSYNHVKTIYDFNNCELDLEKSISFRDFTNYVCEVDDDFQLNKHWRPQYRFVEEISLDFVGKLENLQDDYNYVKKILKLKVELPHYNKTNYMDDLISLEDKNYANYYPAELKKLPCYPNKKLFYTPELIDKVHQRYYKDIEMFNYSFE